MDAKNRWFLIFGETKESHRGWAKIEKNYSKGYRKYHNLGHLESIFKKLDAVFPEHANDKCLNAAIFLHDFFYFRLSSHSEERSAKFSGPFLSALGLDENETRLVSNLILSTKNHLPLSDQQIFKVFLDLDLSILAGPASDYLDYAKNIRDEFWFIPRAYYQRKRSRILKSLLERGEIFLTKKMKEFEAIAINNLKAELALGSLLWSLPPYHSTPLRVEDREIIREIIVAGVPYFQTRHSLEHVERVFAFKADQLSHDEIFVQVEFTQSPSMLVSEAMEGFQEFCEALEKSLEGCTPFTDWYFKVMLPPFERSITPIFK